MIDLARYLDDLNERYLKLHRAKEEAFWETRMGLRDRHRELAEADLALRSFLADAGRLAELRQHRERGHLSSEQEVVLDGWILMFSRNQVHDQRAREILAEIVALEAELQRSRGELELGYRDREGRFVPASSVALANAVRTHPDPYVRKASFEGLRSIERFALENGFPEIVKLRNAFARRIGCSDFYDYKVRWAEGFDKKRLFSLLNDLEQRTRERARVEIAALEHRAGADALQPWNFSYHTRGGNLQGERDAWFQFEDALERWVRSFAALGVRFRNARLTLDLVHREGKYENGFMHGPVPAFRRRGEWLPAEINFAANALPLRRGSGFRTTQTLFHEGGHAAHFANVVMDAPCFSQEFAPTSVAFAETQSMFFDRLLDDADWRARYALDAGGNPMPFELIEKEIRLTQPFAAQGVRSMLAVCYAEKALYEMPGEELTVQRILEVLRAVEREIELLPAGAPRPTLAVPHLLCWESSAYYHGYVLAQMAVYQTRRYFRRKYGRLADEPRVGRDLARTYWAPGNSRPFLDLVQEMTGQPFGADALVEELSRERGSVLREARARWEEGCARSADADGSADPELELRLRVIHGCETVVEEGASPLEAARIFRGWVRKNWPRRAARAGV